MEHVIGIVTQLNGELVKRYFDGRPDAHLNLGDLILLDDSVWSRSLDAKATITLKNSQANFKPGVRIKFDRAYLENVGSYDFLHDYELDEISAKFGLYSNTSHFSGASNLNLNLANTENNQADHANQNPHKTNFAQPNSFTPIAQNSQILGANPFDEAEIFVTPLIGNGNVLPIIEGDTSLYKCYFNDIHINVKTMPGRNVWLLDIDSKTQIAENFASDEGDCFFELKHVKDNSKFGFTVFVFENGVEIFKQKILIEIPHINRHAAFSPIDVLDFDLARKIDKSGVDFIDAIGIKIDAMKKREEDYPISKAFYTNEVNPVFGFISKHEFEAKFYLVGFKDFIFDEMIELAGVIKEDAQKLYFICTNNFKIEGRYTFYANFISKDKSKSPHEFFFDLTFKFDNETTFENVEFNGNQVSGKVLDMTGNSELCSDCFDVGVYSVDIHNNFENIAMSKSDENGNFTIKVELNSANLHDKKVVLRNIDAYGNISQAINIDIK